MVDFFWFSDEQCVRPSALRFALLADGFARCLCKRLWHSLSLFLSFSAPAVHGGSVCC